MSQQKICGDSRIITIQAITSIKSCASATDVPWRMTLEACHLGTGLRPVLIPHKILGQATGAGASRSILPTLVSLHVAVDGECPPHAEPATRNGEVGTWESEQNSNCQHGRTYICHEGLGHPLNCHKFNGFLLAGFDDGGPAATSHLFKEVEVVHRLGSGRNRDDKRSGALKAIQSCKQRKTRDHWGLERKTNPCKKRLNVIHTTCAAFCSQFLSEDEASAVWSSGMILRLGRRGRGFDPRNRPSFFHFETHYATGLVRCALAWGRHVFNCKPS
jgi:hypothetical protein